MSAPNTTPAWLTPPPEPRAGQRRRWLLGCGVALAVVVVLVAVGAFYVSRSLANGFAVVSASNGQIESFRAFSNGSATTITFQAARGLDLRDGPRLACQVVRPALAATDWAGARWAIVNRAGDVIASHETPCP
jgi:hypothetical protein